MIRLFALFFIFYSSLFPAFAAGVCLAHHHHYEHSTVMGVRTPLVIASGERQSINAAQHAQNLAAGMGVNSGDFLCVLK